MVNPIETSASEMLAKSIMENATSVFSGSRKYALIPTSLIHLDTTYQRTPLDNDVNKLAVAWNDAMSDPIKVNYRDGVFYCFDGGHRLAAQSLLGRQVVQCEVQEVPYRDEVMSFVGQRQQVTKMKPEQTFKGNIIIGEPVDTTIKNVCEKLGIKIHTGNMHDKDAQNSLSSMAWARLAVKRGGAECFEWVMRMIRDNNGLQSLSGCHYRPLITRPLVSVFTNNKNDIKTAEKRIVKFLKGNEILYRGDLIRFGLPFTNVEGQENIIKKLLFAVVNEEQIPRDWDERKRLLYKYDKVANRIGL